jgi:hypothetical protein
MDCVVPQQADDEPDDLVSLKSVRRKQKEVKKKERREWSVKKIEERRNVFVYIDCLISRRIVKTRQTKKQKRLNVQLPCRRKNW